MQGVTVEDQAKKPEIERTASTTEERKPQTATDRRVQTNATSKSEGKIEHLNLGRRRAMVTGGEKNVTQDMLRDRTAMPLHIQRKKTNIEIARESRTGEKRSKTKLLEGFFDLMGDANPRSNSMIAKHLDAAWSTVYWLTNMIEFIQSKPKLIRVGSMKRKRIYQIVAPRRR